MTIILSSSDTVLLSSTDALQWLQWYCWTNWEPVLTDLFAGIHVVADTAAVSALLVVPGVRLDAVQLRRTAVVR
jgi:hypothetical protein